MYSPRKEATRRLTAATSHHHDEGVTLMMDDCITITHHPIASDLARMMLVNLC